MRKRGIDVAAKPRSHPINWLDPIVNERAWLGQFEFEIITERQQRGFASPVYFLNRCDTAVRQHNLRISRQTFAHARSGSVDAQYSAMDSLSPLFNICESDWER